MGDCPKAPDWSTPNFKWDGTVPDISRHRIFGCRVYAHVNKEVGCLNARGEEMRYLGFSHSPNFHHIYRVRDRRIFTSDDVTFVETDIKLPEFSGNMELELAGLQDVTGEEKELIDATAERDDEVDWEQQSLFHIDDTDMSRVKAGDKPIDVDSACCEKPLPLFEEAENKPIVVELADKEPMMREMPGWLLTAMILI